MQTIKLYLRVTRNGSPNNNGVSRPFVQGISFLLCLYSEIKTNMEQLKFSFIPFSYFL